MERKDLQKHVVGTYPMLRIGLALLAIAFPVVLTIGGHIRADLPVQHSLSAYYYSGGGAMQDIYVGMLFAMSGFLYLYKGFTLFENYALNLAGVLLIGIVLVPEKWDCGTDCASTLHVALAVLFFVSIAYVCFFRASDTVNLVPDKAAGKRFRKTYKLIGIGMIAGPAMGLLASRFIEPDPGRSIGVFLSESLAVLLFAVYWTIKSAELALTNAEEAAIKGKLISRAGRSGDAFREIPVERVE